MYIDKQIFVSTSNSICSGTKNFFQKAQKPQFLIQYNVFNKILFWLVFINLILQIILEEIQKFIKFQSKNGTNYLSKDNIKPCLVKRKISKKYLWIKMILRN